MIEKKISYDINIEKPSKTKPVKQGGVLNYLGKQKTVNVPVKWRSSKDHPIAHLAYITKDEEKILVDLDLYGSLKGKPNKGPSGIMSLNGGGGGGDGGGGDGGDSGGDSGDSGDAGDSGTGQSGAQSGDNSDGNNADGTDGGPGTDGMGGPGGFGGDDSGVSGTGQEGAQAAENTDMGPAGVATADTEATEADTGIMSTVQNAVTQAVQNAINNPVATIAGIAFGPVAGLAARAISSAVDAANRGVTGPSDDTQETSSVQSGPAQSPGGDGGITTLVPTYAPLVNQTTGDPLLDSLIARYRIDPAAFGIV